jgi:hypothetical protein
MPNLLVITSPESKELRVLDKIKQHVNILGIGRNLAELQNVSEEQWSSVDVLLNCGAPETV